MIQCDENSFHLIYKKKVKITWVNLFASFSLQLTVHLKAFASVGAILKIINWKKKERRFEVFRKLIIHGLNKQVDCRSLMNDGASF